MLYKFKSKVTGDVIMLQPNGERLLEIIGKRNASEPAAKGILLPGQMAQALAAIDDALAQEEAQRREAVTQAQKENLPPPRLEAVTLRQRALPLMDMMRQCEAVDEPIVWGV
ncbi:MAG: DUF1840 domain-containing protein [Rhodoferax sp.]|nr:DUF1840 domain-containing protein [Rhodoferax sp.]OIP20998.1 MAG: hypothetical protein AUK52_09575 [Comamonadaceae bacterium CG2_30_60_41]PIW09430.1 MAG: DUF1840 domain-containing protein [Comamonadaceae bacterium CG17_big_fil_post_rev_8_21_14_2_50_60_13]PIY26721.1 MAG: DUF1840 domain-containing protein [Comamonadaceae bacterium CG_4_10_14_3_um_filter_60_75]PJC17903.1 MAG: DUF1840 domain-containing protein [Comamonadaceae bacterium CG_4_9_14_0_8_um_filter_60_18]